MERAGARAEQSGNDPRDRTHVVRFTSLRRVRVQFRSTTECRSQISVTMFRKTPQGTNTFKTSDRMGNPVEGSPGERSPTRGWASVDSPESRRLVAEKMRLVLVLLCLHVVVFQILAGVLIYLDGGDVRGILVSLVRYPLPGPQYCVGP